MDTRDQSPNKLIRLHDKSHPTHHRPASLRRNYSRPVVNIMKLVMKDGWWWRWRRIPLSGAPNGLQISPPDEEQEVAVAPYRKTWWNFFSYFFLREREFIALELGQTAACGPHKASGRALGGSRPVALWATGAPLLFILAPAIFIYSIKNLQKVLSNSENFDFCTKTTQW